MNQMELTKKIKAQNNSSDIFMFISVLAGVAATFLVIWLVHLFMTGQAAWGNIALAGAGVCLLQLLKAIFYAAGIRHAHDAAYRSLAEIRLMILEHLKQLPLSFFHKRKVGDLTNIISHDVEQIEIYLAHARPEIVITILLPLLAAASLLVIDWRLALALVAPIPVMFLYQKFIYRIWAKTLARYIQSTREMSADLIEYISTIPAVKAFATDEQKTAALLSRMKAYIAWVKKIMYTVSVPMSLIQMLLEIGLVLVVIVGAGLMLGGELPVTRFILALVLAGLFSASLIKYMSFHHADIVLGRAAESIATILGEKPRPDYPHDRELRAGDIELHDVSFSYNGRENALQGINLTFKEETVSAVVGASGSGKSTIANLIMGFWPAERGWVTIGGKDAAKRRQSGSVAGYVGRFSVFFELSYAVMIVTGALLVFHGSLAIATYLLFIIFSREFYKPFGKIEKYWLDYLQVKDSHRRVAGILDAPVVPEAAAPQQVKSFDIEYENANFSYAAGSFALENINFRLPQGTLTAPGWPVRLG